MPHKKYSDGFKSSKPCPQLQIPKKCYHIIYYHLISPGRGEDFFYQNLTQKILGSNFGKKKFPPLARFNEIWGYIKEKTIYLSLPEIFAVVCPSLCR